MAPCHLAMSPRIALGLCDPPLLLVCRGTSGIAVCSRVARALLAGIPLSRIHLWPEWCLSSPRAATATSPEHSLESRLTTVLHFHIKSATPLTVAVSVPTDRIKHMGVLPTLPCVLRRPMQPGYRHAPSVSAFVLLCRTIIYLANTGRTCRRESLRDTKRLCQCSRRPT
jgi:hypothetical protein